MAPKSSAAVTYRNIQNSNFNSNLKIVNYLIVNELMKSAFRLASMKTLDPTDL